MKTSQKLALSFWSVLLGSVLAEQVFYFEWANSSEYKYLSIIVFAAIIFGWFLVDTRERGFSASMPLKVAVAALGALAVPYYKFRHFGIRAGFRFLGLVIVGLVIVVLVAAAVDISVRYDGAT